MPQPLLPPWLLVFIAGILKSVLLHVGCMPAARNKQFMTVASLLSMSSVLPLLETALLM